MDRWTRSEYNARRLEVVCLKGAFVPQSKPVPFKASSRYTMMDNSRQALPEKDRKVRTRTSAATLGLAIAMGTSSFIVLRQGDSVMAAEPVADTAVGDASLTEAQRTSSEATTKATTNTSEETPEAVTHVVQEDENLWTLARMYGTPVTAIAEANDLQLTVLLHVGQELKIPHPQNPHPEAAKGIANSDRANKQQVSQKNTSQTQLEAEKAEAAVPDSEKTQENFSDTAGTLLQQSQTRENRSPEADTASQDSTSTTSQTQTDSERASAKERSPSIPSSTSSQNKATTNNDLPRSEVVASATNKKTENAPEIPSSSSENMVASQLPEVPSLSESIDGPLGPEGTSQNNDRIAQLPKGASESLSEPTLANQTIKHQVRPGDTIYSLARQYDISPSEIIKHNGMKNPNLIEVGQTLLIPRQGQPTAENAPTIAFNVDMTGDRKAPLVGGDVSQVTGSKATAVLPDIQLSDSLTDRAPLIGAEESTPVGIDRETGSLEVPGKQMLEEIETTGSVAYHFSQEQTSTNTESKYQPYVEGLQAEISRLRDRSHRETAPLTAPSVAEVEANTNQETLPSILSNHEGANRSQTTESVNPEFAARNRSSEGPEAVPSQGNSNNSTPSTADGSTDRDSETVAVAPLGAENYAPMMPSRMVSPELPPLPEPNRMIPEGKESSFNGYIWPAKGVVTSGYGWRWGRMHRGIDIAGPIGTPIVASASGVVTKAGWNSGGYGHLVKIEHSDGSLTLYAHNSRVLVGQGQRVEQGQQVAEMGNSGYSTGPHLHFEVHPPGKGAVNPLAYLPSKRSR